LRLVLQGLIKAAHSKPPQDGGATKWLRDLGRAAITQVQTPQ
jgi:hypothetical protein